MQETSRSSVAQGIGGMRWLIGLLLPVLAGCEFVSRELQHRADMENSVRCLEERVVAACTAVIESKTLSTHFHMLARVRRAERFLASGMRSEALGDFQAVLTTHPDDPIALLGAARILVDRGDYTAARPLLLHSVDVHDSGIAREMLGGIALRTGDYSAAIDNFSGSLDRTQGRSSLALLGRATAKECLGDNVGAREDRARAIPLHHERDAEDKFWEDGKCASDGS